MQPAPEQRPHVRRLQSLASRFREQAHTMAQELRELQQRLELAHRATCISQLDGDDDVATRLADCRDLQLACDELATQLVHVRLAIAGADEELQQFGRSAPLVGQRRPA